MRGYRNGAGTSVGQLYWGSRPRKAASPRAPYYGAPAGRYPPPAAARVSWRARGAANPRPTRSRHAIGARGAEGALGAPGRAHAHAGAPAVSPAHLPKEGHRQNVASESMALGSGPQGRRKRPARCGCRPAAPEGPARLSRDAQGLHAGGSVCEHVASAWGPEFHAQVVGPGPQHARAADVARAAAARWAAAAPRSAPRPWWVAGRPAPGPSRRARPPPAPALRPGRQSAGQPWGRGPCRGWEHHLRLDNGSRIALPRSGQLAQARMHGAGRGLRMHAAAHLRGAGLVCWCTRRMLR